MSLYAGCATQKEIDAVTGQRVNRLYGETVFDELKWQRLTTKALGYITHKDLYPHKQQWASETLTKAELLDSQAESIIQEGREAKRRLSNGMGS